MSYFVYLIGFSGVVFWTYVLFICYLAEKSLGDPKIDSTGALVINPESIPIKWFYGTNADRSNDKRKYPKNSCQLFRNLFLGFPFGLVIVILISIFFLLFLIFAWFCGFIPSSSSRFTLLPYQIRETKKEDLASLEKYVAPWKFLSPLILLWYFGFFHLDSFLLKLESKPVREDNDWGLVAFFQNLLEGFQASIFWFKNPPVLFFEILIGTFILILILFITKQVLRTKGWVATRTFIKDKHELVCTRTVVATK